MLITTRESTRQASNRCLSASDKPEDTKWLKQRTKQTNLSQPDGKQNYQVRRFPAAKRRNPSNRKSAKLGSGFASPLSDELDKRQKSDDKNNRNGTSKRRLRKMQRESCVSSASHTPAARQRLFGKSAIRPRPAGNGGCLVQRMSFASASRLVSG